MSDTREVTEVTIERMAQGGEGVGRSEGLVVFVQGGLPGERVRVHIHERKASYARGSAQAILTPSPERVTPRLPGASHIPWQHIAYPAQLRYKREIVRQQLAKLAGLDNVRVDPVLPAEQQWGYRNTAHLHIQDGGRQIGYYAAGTRTVVDLKKDPLLLPVLNDALAGLHDVLPLRDCYPTSVTLRGSAAYGRVVGVVRGEGKLELLAERWQQRVTALSGCVVERRKKPSGMSVVLREKLGGVVFLLSPDSFFQTHPAQAEILLNVVEDALALVRGDRVLDAYSGVGAFALPLSYGLREVVAIEENPTAVADGKRSTAYNEIGNVTFVTGQVERAIGSVAPPFDSVVLDPPRRGCHPDALAAVCKLAPPRVAYVSCHPGILARDVRVLLEGGYQLAWVQPVDMFPQTPHIECVALLLRQPEQ